jgi:hypothetical protein
MKRLLATHDVDEALLDVTSPRDPAVVRTGIRAEVIAALEHSELVP